MKVNADPSKPNSNAGARPSGHALARSAAELIAMRHSLFSMLQFFFASRSLFEIQYGSNSFQRETQLHQGQCHVRLDAGDDGFRTP